MNFPPHLKTASEAGISFMGADVEPQQPSSAGSVSDGMAAQTLVAVTTSPPQLGRGKRQRKARDIGDLTQCLCGDSVSKSSADAIKCNRNGCETGWVRVDRYLN